MVCVNINFRTFYKTKIKCINKKNNCTVKNTYFDYWENILLDHMDGIVEK